MDGNVMSAIRSPQSKCVTCKKVVDHRFNDVRQFIFCIAMRVWSSSTKTGVNKWDVYKVLQTSKNKKDLSETCDPFENEMSSAAAFKTAMTLNMCASVIALLYISRANRFAFGYVRTPVTKPKMTREDKLLDLFYDCEAAALESSKYQSVVGMPKIQHRDERMMKLATSVSNKQQSSKLSVRQKAIIENSVKEANPTSPPEPKKEDVTKKDDCEDDDCDSDISSSGSNCNNYNINSNSTSTSCSDSSSDDNEMEKMKLVLKRNRKNHSHHQKKLKVLLRQR